MTIEQRIKVIAEVVLGQKIYEKLESESGISMHSWKNALNKKQRATSEMIEFVARKCPQFAFWMVTGESVPAELKHETIITLLSEKLNLNSLSEAELKELRLHIDERLKNDD